MYIYIYIYIVPSKKTSILIKGYLYYLYICLSKKTRLISKYFYVNCPLKKDIIVKVSLF